MTETDRPNDAVYAAARAKLAAAFRAVDRCPNCAHPRRLVYIGRNLRTVKVCDTCRRATLLGADRKTVRILLGSEIAPPRRPTSAGAAAAGR